MGPLVGVGPGPLPLQTRLRTGPAWTKSDNLPIDESGVKSDNSISIQKISTHKHKVRLHMINTNLFASFPVIIDYIGDKTRVWRGMIKKDANYCM